MDHHDHAHSHVHRQRDIQTGLSLLGMSSARRMAGAVLLCALLWAAVLSVL
jgi:hypothetical protein